MLCFCWGCDNKKAGAELCQAETSLNYLPTSYGVASLCREGLLCSTIFTKLARAEKNFSGWVGCGWGLWWVGWRGWFDQLGNTEEKS